jgi:FtsH-binding integral membrane protein
MIPLLQDPEIVLDIDQQPLKEKLFTSPLFVFSLLLIIIIILTASVRRKTVNNIIDIFLFSVFSILALLMIFFNFFTDHHQLRWNLNIIWLNPFIILCLTSLVFKKDWSGWFGIVFYLAVLFLLFLAVLPQHINNAKFYKGWF